VTAHEENLVPIDDDDLKTSIAVILAAHSDRFPQLRGAGVKPYEKDDKRQAFAHELVSRLRMSGVRFFRCDAGDYAGKNSKWFGPKS
jgi:hypothetical protein